MLMRIGRMLNGQLAAALSSVGDAHGALAALRAALCVDGAWIDGPEAAKSKAQPTVARLQRALDALSAQIGAFSGRTPSLQASEPPPPVATAAQRRSRGGAAAAAAAMADAAPLRASGRSRLVPSRRPRRPAE